MNFLSTNEFRCPHCESLLNTATGATNEDKPKDGHWTICLECAGICVYVIQEENNVSLRKPTQKEIDETKERRPAFWFEAEQMIDFVKNKPKK